MIRTLAIFLTLSSIWLLLSGHFDTLLLGFGLVSVVGTMWCARRMRQSILTDVQPQPITYRSQIIESLRYCLWLGKEIIVSNIAVARCVWMRNMPIDPVSLVVSDDDLDDIGKVIYANSITLTPGTVSLFLRDDGIHVHALTQDGAQQLAQGEMLERVKRLRVVQSWQPSEQQ